MSEVNIEAKLKALEETQQKQGETISKQAETIEKLSQENEQLKTTLGKVVTSADEKPTDEPKIPTDTFKSGNKTYKFTVPKFIIPGIGERTALEVLADTTTYPKLKGKTIKAWLAAAGSAVIEEVAA